MNQDETIYIVEAEMARADQRLKKVSRKAELSEAEKIRMGEVTNFHKHIRRLIEVYNRDRSIAFGRIPPHAEELERSVLGALMLHVKPSAMTESLQRIKSFLRPEHFYNDAHQEIYKAIVNLSEPDVQSVHNQLRREGLSEKVGGPAYIAGLTAGVVNGFQEQNARILVEFAIKRKLIMIGTEFMSEGYNEASDALEVLQAAKEEINTTEAWIR